MFEELIQCFLRFDAKNAGNEFNIMAKMSEKTDKLIKCPDCGSNDLSSVFKNINITKSRSSDATDCPNVHKCGGCCHH